ncbi:MAG: hypothetical protein FJ134_06380 [Deltaproteobacteria bacterium]|nr:hypothetical protein [Deltaproteobacteria bacterium]
MEESLRTIMSGTGDIQGKIDALLELLHRGSQEQGTFDFQKTSQTIINGRVLLALKQCIRQVRGAKWSTWADEHIPDLSERTRQIWMTLGKCGDAREFAHLGEDRLLRIIRRQRSTNSRLSIGAFLEDHSIEQPGGEASVDLKVLVDRALRRPRGAGRRRGVQASPPPPPFNELLASLQNQARELISQGPDGLAQVDREALTALETTLAELRANIST